MKLKIVAYILIVLAIASIVYNATLLNLNDPFVGESQIAVYSIIIAFCAVILLAILMISYRINDKVEAERSKK